jgi:hypothetical protein
MLFTANKAIAYLRLNKKHFCINEEPVILKPDKDSIENDEE